MITKAIIKELPKAGNNKYKVSIPIFEGVIDEGARARNKSREQESTPLGEVVVTQISGTPRLEDDTLNVLQEATFCCPPGMTDCIHEGDVVYVGFEDNNLARPVILGHLYGAEANSHTFPSIKAKNLEVSGSDENAPSTVKLPITTSIGDISGAQIDSMHKQISNLVVINNL